MAIDPPFHGKLPKLDWSSLGSVVRLQKVRYQEVRCIKLGRLHSDHWCFGQWNPRQHYRDCHVHSGSWQPSCYLGRSDPLFKNGAATCRRCPRTLCRHEHNVRLRYWTMVLWSHRWIDIDWRWEATSSGLNESTEARPSPRIRKQKSVPAVPQIRVALSVHVRAVLTRVCDILTVSGAEPQE